MELIGIKHPRGAAYYAITTLATPHEAAAISVSQHDILTTRAPNHLEARRLRTDPGEHVVEIQCADGTVEVYRSARTVLRARGDIQFPGQTVPDGVAFRLNMNPVTGPDLHKPYWQHVYHDITDDIATGRLTTGAAIGTLEQLADSYVLSSDKIQQALNGLRTDRLITAIDGTWYIAGRAPE